MDAATGEGEVTENPPESCNATSHFQQHKHFHTHKQYSLDYLKYLTDEQTNVSEHKVELFRGQVATHGYAIAANNKETTVQHVLKQIIPDFKWYLDKKTFDIQI